MMGPTHRIFGALCGAAVASAAGEGRSMVAMTAIVAMTTAHGPSSPDMDQTDPWRAVQKVSGPLSPLFTHRRGLSHWFALPILAWFAVQLLPAAAHWPAYALIVGWSSHLLGDFVFGRLYLFPWGGPGFGVGLRTDGFIEDGSVRWGGRKVTVLPFGPTRLAIAAALAYVLYATPSFALPTITTIGALP